MPWFMPIGRSNTIRSFAYRAALRDRRAAQPDRFGGEQHALGVKPVQDDLEALPFLADEVLFGHEQVAR